MLKILPQLFYNDPSISKVLVDGLSCIIHKKLHQAVLDKEGYVSTHAITLVLKGLLRAEDDEGAITNVSENQLIFLPKGIYTITDKIPSNGVFEAIVFFFDEDLISSFISSVNLNPRKDKQVKPIVFSYTKEIRVFTESLMELYSNKEFSHRKLTKPKLFELLHLISISRQNDSLLHALSTLNNRERKSLHEFMNANFSKPLGIEDYAYLTGRSLSTFRRDFINQFGIGPKQWLIDKRLEKAFIFLSNNHGSISQVAMEVGYENMSHFIKAFHQKYGISPKQFLMQKRKEVSLII
jgi:AraC family transcriptional regulator, exoenzyme S synthesis regulatory protein ExsA